MVRSFVPFFAKGNLLELGSFKGDFTGRFGAHFTDRLRRRFEARPVYEKRRL
jgi:hypothetical protein